MNEEFLKEFKEALRKFLKAHGGQANGYETRVFGEIRPNVHSYISWETPKSYDITRREHQRLAAQLYDELYEICKKYNEFDIELYDVPYDYGIYDIYIKKITKERFLM